MFRFFALFFSILLSANTFAFKLVPQHDDRVFVINDNGQHIATFSTSRYRLFIEIWGKTVKVFNTDGQLVNEFHEQTTTPVPATPIPTSPATPTTAQSATTSDTRAAHSSTKRKLDSGWNSAFEKRPNFSSDDNDTSTSTTHNDTNSSTESARSNNTYDADDNDSAENDEFLDIIASNEHHDDVLLEAIETARTNLLISTETITRLPKRIYSAFIQAAERGVKIYIYVNNPLDHKAYNFLDGIANLQQRNIHAKFLIKDNTEIVIGSYNWLDFRHPSGVNTSFRIANWPALTYKMKEDIWEIIRHYGNRYYGNLRALQRELSDDSIFEEKHYDIGETSALSLLTSLEAHENFWNKACRSAQKSIVIKSPFLNFNNALSRISRCARMVKPGVKVNLYIWENQEQKQRLERYISTDPRYSQIFSVHTLDPNDHSKTLIVDGYKIHSEGSFNWLSSSMDETSPGHNLDATIVLSREING